jgi:excisionase family DNA binding protein
VLALYHTPVPEQEIISVEKAAEIIGNVKPRRVRQFIAEGRLPAIRVVSTYLIKWTDLLNFVTVPRKSGRQSEPE